MISRDARGAFGADIYRAHAVRKVGLSDCVEADEERAFEVQDAGYDRAFDEGPFGQGVGLTFTFASTSTTADAVIASAYTQQFCAGFTFA